MAKNPSSFDGEIKRLYLTDKITMHEIASRLHISVGKVYNRLKNMEVPSRKPSDYPVSLKVIEHARRLGKSWKGALRSETTKKKISESRFKGGIGHKKIRHDGYISVYFPDHPCSSVDGYVMEHILVMEAIIGRHLNDDECVHHINFIKTDNRASNLQVMTINEHMSYHMTIRNQKRRNDLSIR
jgi:hypothetical protein